MRIPGKGPGLDGGTLFTQFSHYIDALLWLWGDIKKVTGFRKNITHKGIIQSEDSGVVALEMENGILGGLNWSVNSFQKKHGGVDDALLLKEAVSALVANT
jgi:predicted dehydrogenase